PLDPLDSSSDSAALTVAYGHSTAYFTDDSGSRKGRFDIGTDVVFVTVTDADQNHDPDSIETVPATLTVAGSGDAESVVLVETGPNTGVFRNTSGIPTSPVTPAVPQDGVLEGRRGYFIDLAYTDPADPSDSASDQAVFSAGRSASTTRVTTPG